MQNSYLQFNKTNYISIPHDDIFNFSTNDGNTITHEDISISFWAKNILDGPVISKTDSYGYGWLVSFLSTSESSDDLYLNFKMLRGIGVSEEFSISVRIQALKNKDYWSHFVIVIDRDSDVYFYMNGQQIYNKYIGDWNNVLLDTSTDLILGGIEYNNSVLIDNYFGGGLDDIRFYRETLLDSNQISYIYSDGLGAKCSNGNSIVNNEIYNGYYTNADDGEGNTLEGYIVNGGVETSHLSNSFNLSDINWEPGGIGLIEGNVTITDGLQGPSIISPNGGEEFSEREVLITWSEPKKADFQSTFWYEIFYVDNYEQDAKNKWKQVAIVPSGVSSYLWKLNDSIKSLKCRIGIRAINQKGEKSKLSISSNNFKLNDRRLPIPSVSEPIPGRTYYSYVPIILDKEGLVGQCSQRAFYRIYYACNSLDIDWTVIYNDIPIENRITYWNISNFNMADDYKIKVELKDGELSSEPVFIEDIKIASSNSFIVDTMPPEGYIRILNNQEYVSSRNLNLELSAYDVSTDVQKYRVEQYDIGIEEQSEENVGDFLSMSNFSTWNIRGNDGVKLIQSRFKDFAGNIKGNSDDDKLFFRTYKSLNNSVISSFLYVKNGNSFDAYIAFGDNASEVYKNKNMLFSLSKNITSMSFYNNSLYFATHNNAHGVLSRYSNGEFSDLATINERDSIITSMAKFDDKLFLGTFNGKLYSFNGISLSLERTNDDINNDISFMGSDNNNLLVFFNNTTKMLILSKKDDIYNYSTIDMES